MGRFLIRRQWMMWIACCAILLNALAPSISHALGTAHNASPLIEICTSAGIKYITLDGSPPVQSPTGDLLHHLDHCPFCLGDAHTPPLPASLTILATPASSYAGFPPLYYASPAPLFSWSPAHPRAPPAYI